MTEAAQVKLPAARLFVGIAHETAANIELTRFAHDTVSLTGPYVTEVLH